MTEVIVARLARVCNKDYVSLKDAIDRAKIALDSENELRRLCRDAYDRICDLKAQVDRCKNYHS